VPRGASSAADAAQREEAVLWAAGTASKTSVVKTSVTKKSATRNKVIVDDPVGKVFVDDAESLAIQEIVAMQYPPVGKTTTSSVRMGRSLVSGALGMRLDDPKYFEATVKLAECTVILQSTRRKAKAPVSAPPPNSIESEREPSEAGDVQLSQSATDIGVFVGLPDAGVEMMSTEMSGTKGSQNVANVCAVRVADAQGVAMTPAMSTRPVEIIAESCEVVIEEHDESMKETEVVEAKNAKDAECKRMLDEIDKSKLIHDELVRQDPSLASVSSFLNIVCGVSTGGKTAQKKEEDKAKVMAGRIVPIPVFDEVRTSAEDSERQITVAEVLSKEDFAKNMSSSAAVVIFRDAAAADDKSERENADIKVRTTEVIPLVSCDEVMGNAESRIITTPETSYITSGVLTGVHNEATPEPELPTHGQYETEIVVSDDIAMSVGDSEEEEEDESDGFSRTGSSSSRCESVPSRGSRKRPADESPERELRENLHGGFPGVVSRSEAGCRIYVRRRKEPEQWT